MENKVRITDLQKHIELIQWLQRKLNLIKQSSAMSEVDQLLISKHQINLQADIKSVEWTLLSTIQVLLETAPIDNSDKYIMVLNKCVKVIYYCNSRLASIYANKQGDARSYAKQLRKVCARSIYDVSNRQMSRFNKIQFDDDGMPYMIVKPTAEHNKRIRAKLTQIVVDKSKLHKK